MKATTVSIVHDDSTQAGKDIAAELLDELGGAPDLVLLFASTRYNPEQLLTGLYSRLPATTKLAGCSSFAEINSDEALTGSVTAMGIRLGGVACEVFKVDGLKDRNIEAGRALAEQIKAFEPSLVITFPDAVGTNSAQFLIGMQDILGRKFPIVGGVAADDLQFDQTYELFNRKVLSGGAVAVALKGRIAVASGAKAGFQPLGAARTCTKVENGRLVLELDGVPALNLYKEFLGDRANDLQTAGIEFPLGIVGGMPGEYQVSDEQILVVRAVQGVDEARMGLICSGEVLEGARVRMTRATKEDILQGAVSAVDEAKKIVPEPSAAFIFDCAGRKLVLGPRYKDEIQAVVSRLGPDVPAIGFYTYGELSPVQGVTMHHDETFTIALIQA
ncbi:MAG: FIST C-terminal domain-containing protein [Polyangiaceae bacterium]|nr:FIST C-terminal domain-containing protein [Polyangiaceae bacterium]